MLGKIHHWETKLKETTDLFNNTFGHLTEVELNWKPNSEVWSIAQNIHHLITTNEQYHKTIEAIRNGSATLPFIARFDFITRFLGNSIYNALEPTNHKKIKTFSVFEPNQGSNFKDDILDKFGQHQKEMITFLYDCQDLLEKNQIISSPVNRYIVYTLEKAFDIITIHELRHYNQASDLLKLRKFGKAIT